MAASALPACSPSRTAIVANPYHDEVLLAQQRQPSGACGYKELGPGHTCGCLRFSYSANNVPFQEPSREQGLCYCGHHACFHAWKEPVEEQRTVENGRVYTRLPSHECHMNTIPVAESPQRRSFLARTPGSIAAAVGLSQTSSSRFPPPTPHSEHPRFNPFRPSPDELPSTQSSFKLPFGVLNHDHRQYSPSPSRRFVTQLSNARVPSSLGIPGLLVPPPVAETVRSPTELATPSASMIGTPEVRAADAAFQGIGEGLEQYRSCLENQHHTLPVSERSAEDTQIRGCLLYTSPSPRDGLLSRMPSSA